MHGHLRHPRALVTLLALGWEVGLLMGVTVSWAVRLLAR